MDTRINLFAVCVILVSVNVCEPCTQVFNINGACDTASNEHGTGETRIENIGQLLVNISTIWSEYEQRLATLLGQSGCVSRPRDCQDIQALGFNTTGVYTIYPDPGKMRFQVRCDMNTTDGGWTVIQRRVSNSDFYKSWNEYQVGFGDLNENFWLGNQQIHLISTQGWYELRVDMVSTDNEVAYAAYQTFSVGDVDSAYKLSADGYSGTAGNSLDHHMQRKFSTKDRDNDDHDGNCAVLSTGAWWYGACHNSNLNGVYGATGAKGPIWQEFKGDDGPLKMAEMKIRRWKH